MQRSLGTRAHSRSASAGLSFFFVSLPLLSSGRERRVHLPMSDLPALEGPGNAATTKWRAPTNYARARRNGEDLACYLGTKLQAIFRTAWESYSLYMVQPSCTFVTVSGTKGRPSRERMHSEISNCPRGDDARTAGNARVVCIYFDAIAR